MDHEFQASLTDSKKCTHCKRSWKDHSKLAQCEACPKVGVCELFCDMLLCKSCFAAEMEANRIQSEAHQTPEKQEERLNAAREQQNINSLINQANQIDQSIQLVQDIYNAKTIALIEIMKEIDGDNSIENK